MTSIESQPIMAMGVPSGNDQTVGSIERIDGAASLSESSAGRVHGVVGRMRLGKDLSVPTPSSDSDVSGTPTESKNWMDDKRRNMVGYEYLCRIGEAKQWIEACIQEELPSATTLDEAMRNGVYLAKIARAFEPELVRKIFEDPRLQFRHSDNINYCFQFMKKVGLPKYFTFELTDLYDLKNFPRVIYSVHALSHLLAQKGIAPKIKSLVGKLDFTNDEVDAMQENLDKSGLSMPSFGNVDKALELEMAPQKTPADIRREHLAKNVDSIVKCQAFARRMIARKLCLRLKEANLEIQKQAILLQQKSEAAVALQALFRGHQARKESRAFKLALSQAEPAIVALQAHVRGLLARKHCAMRRNFYSKNEDAIVSIQSWLKYKRQHTAYSLLKTDKDPSLSVVGKFVQLLDGGARDLEEELLLETLKQTAVKQIRENALIEQHLNDLDIKIALLVKNRTTLDEVVRISSKKLKKSLSDEEVRKAAQVFHLKSLDKSSRLKLEAYQTMFYLLQTNPKYLTRLLWVMRDWNTDLVRRLIETSVLTIFSYAQNAREEYLLLKQLSSAIDLEVGALTDINEFVQSNPVFIKLVLQYVRGAKERQYLPSILQSTTTRVCACTSDLDLDPVQVHKLLIKEEESTTGYKSSKKYDASREDALLDPQTTQRVAKNFEKLEVLVRAFIETLSASVGRMPYGIRYTAKQLYHAMQTRFPKEKHVNLLRVVGNLIYYRYINPALVAPDAFDVTEATISPLHRKNLSEFAKLVNVIASGKSLDAHLSFATDFVNEASKMFLTILEQIINVQSPEAQLSIDSYSDAARLAKPVIYISPNEIFSLHATMFENIDQVCPEADDTLRGILNTLGVPPPVQNDNTGPEICLELKPILDKDISKDNEYDLRRLFVTTKKHVVLLLRVHNGSNNLLDMLECPSTDVAEDRFLSLRDEAATIYASAASLLSRSRSITVLSDVIPPASLSQLKVRVLEDMAILEEGGFVNRSDKFQSMLTSIAHDIRNKHRRREQLQIEKSALSVTVATLMKKHAWLQEQGKSYQDYINTCMHQLTAHQSMNNKKWVSPFGRQSRHLRELERQSKTVPKFGSHKYSAKELMDRGIVTAIDVEVLPTKMYEKLGICVSSNQQGIFDVECTFNALGVTVTNETEVVRLEDLLSLQFENKAETKLFDGRVVVNVNLLIFFINKKFYA